MPTGCRADEAARKVLEDAGQVRVCVEVAAVSGDAALASVVAASSAASLVVRQVLQEEKELNDSLERQLQDFVVYSAISL